MAFINNLLNLEHYEIVREYAVQLLLFFIVTFLCYKTLNRPKKLPPGPIGLPFVGYLPFIGKEPHKTFLTLSKKYGDIFSLRMGQHLTVVVNEYKVFKEAMSHPAAMDRASEKFAHIPGIGFGELNGTEWEEQRRFCMQSARSLGLGRGTWETNIQEEVACFLNDLRSLKGQPVEISHKLNAAIGGNIMSLLIGRKLNRESEDDKIQLSLDFNDAALIASSNATAIFPFLRKFYEFFKIGGYDEAAQAMSGFTNFVREEVKNHKVAPERLDDKDFINLYLEKMKQMSSKNEKSYFSDANLEGNVKILFLGASDTIFSSLTWLFRLMAKYSDVQKKVQDELDEVIGRERMVSYEERFNIPYTFAVMLETQRHSTMITTPVPRRARFDFEIQGYTIPKGTEIVSNVWALHCDPNYWAEPEKFKPERFLSADKKKVFTNLPSFAPFSIGRRNCPGETVAWMEILNFFTSIMQHFTISMSKGVEPKFETVYRIVTHLKPQPLCFIERPDQS